MSKLSFKNLPIIFGLHFLLCFPVLADWEKGLDAYEKGDYNREIEEQVGGLPRRDLSFGRLKADLREKMKLEGYKKHIFGIPQT